jgi:hypothetical protein
MVDNSTIPPAIEPLYSDAQVAQMLDPTGARIKARSIRSEREAGRLVGTRIAGKWLYRGSDVAAFLNAAREVNRQCPVQTAVPGLILSEKRDGLERSGTSVGPSAEKSSKGQRLSMPPILGQLANSLKTGCTSVDAPPEPAQVIPIRSE